MEVTRCIRIFVGNDAEMTVSGKLRGSAKVRVRLLLGLGQRSKIVEGVYGQRRADVGKLPKFLS
jgi:hypothetical protein